VFCKAKKSSLLYIYSLIGERETEEERERSRFKGHCEERSGKIQKNIYELRLPSLGDFAITCITSSPHQSLGAYVRLTILNISFSVGLK
jgi:hypothetical protein